MPETLFAGFGRRDITPHDHFPNGMWMAQVHTRGEGLHRRLYTNCLIAGSRGEAVALLNYDLCILSPIQVAAIKAAVQKAIGLPEDRIWLYVTHNHAAPVTQDFYNREGADEVQAYIEALPGASADAARQAWESRRAVRVGGGTGQCRIAVNRDLNHHGRMITGPYFEGFTDPEVGVIRLDEDDGKAVAAVVTYACHPTYLGPQNKLISADYPGVTRDIFEDLTGAPCIFLQAGGGNAGPLRGFLGTTTEVERDGRILACVAAQTFLSIETRKTEKYIGHVIESGAPLGIIHERPIARGKPVFQAISRKIPLPAGNPGPTVYDTVEDDLKAAAQRLEMLRQTGAPEPDIEHAMQQHTRHRLRLERKQLYLSARYFPVDICAMRMNQLCLVTLGCEAYAELGAAIKQRSPFKETIFAAYEGADVIYVAPKKYYEPPVPMEVSNSPFGPEAAGILVDEAVKVLEELSRL